MSDSLKIQDQAKTAAVQQCACFNLRKAARAVTQLYDDVLRPTGLRATQFSLLSVLQIVGKATITELADRAVMDRTTLKRNLELLEREGLIRIRPGEDARVRQATLTPAAQQKLAQALPYWAKAQGQITTKLGLARSNQLLSNLTAAIAAARPEN